PLHPTSPAPSPSLNVQKRLFIPASGDNVIMLNFMNYSTFKTSCRSTLLVARAWSITKGTELCQLFTHPPEGKDWIIRKDRALQIIYNSTTREIRSTLSKYMDNQDPLGLWKHLEDEYDLSKDVDFVFRTLNQFHNDKIQPTE